MTESFEPDKEMAELFAAESARDQQGIEAEILIAQLDKVLVDALDRHGADHMWHPDPDESDRLVAEEGARIEQADILTDENRAIGISGLGLAKLHLMREIGMANAILSAMLLKHYGETKAQEVKDKKRLQAQLQINEFDTGWQSAVDDLLEGPPLDLSDEADLQIYIEASMPKENSLVRRALDGIKQVLVRTDFTESGGNRHWRLVVEVLGIFLKTTDSGRLPNAESAIDELARAGRIDRSEAASLRQLLRSMQPNQD